ncbi:MAG: hypothetical protein ISS34_01395 [Candidatus Omnitrophica bacterium]|nr:hypothetical protein [Candidatus Omnitrophota bacterium]
MMPDKLNRNFLIGLSLLIIASVLLLSSTVAFYILKEAEKSKLTLLKNELENVVEMKDIIAEDLEEIKAKNSELELKLSSTSDQARKISEEFSKEKEIKNLMTSQLEHERKKTEEMMSQVLKEKEERLNLSYKLSKVEEDYRRLKEQFELLLEAKEALEAKVRSMMEKKGIELEKIEVKRGYRVEEPKEEKIFKPQIPGKKESASKPDTKTTVLVVNRQFNFIVTNIGKLDGAGIGSELDVYRGGEFIAKTRIEKLYDKMSAATILPEWKRARIKEGDQVYPVRPPDN